MNKETEKSRIYEEGFKLLIIYLLEEIERLIVILKDKLENILTTDNPLSNRGAMAICCRVLLSAVLKYQ